MNAGGPFRPLAQGQRSEITIIRADGSGRHVVHSVKRLLEAPNWTPDGKSLIINGGGGLFRLPVAGGVPVAIPITGITNANNDHLLSPDGRTLYISAGGAVYSVPIEGGVPTQVSPNGSLSFFVYGISPDGTTLVCTTIGQEKGDTRWGIHFVPAVGGDAICLLVSDRPVDGPDFSVDGEWIYFNGELGAAHAGPAHLFKIRQDGTKITQLTYDSGVDWFPHPCPDGNSLVYMRYPPGTEGHPSDCLVTLRIMSLDDGISRDLVTLFGGQGTFNVSSWAPDGSAFAYVAYPLAAAI